MNEVLPGIFHWTRTHPKIQFEVSSYFLPNQQVLIDPLVPTGGMETIPGKPRHVVLTNRHHYRDSGEIAERFDCKIWCVESGLHEFTSGEKVEPFRFGDRLPCGIETVEIGVICPDDTALVIPECGGILALADGLVRMGDGPLTFVPDAYMGDDPETVKTGLRESLRRLLEREFDHLLFAHGSPWIGGAKEALREFVGA